MQFLGGFPSTPTRGKPCRLTCRVIMVPRSIATLFPSPRWQSGRLNIVVETTLVNSYTLCSSVCHWDTWVESFYLKEHPEQLWSLLASPRSACRSPPACILDLACQLSSPSSPCFSASKSKNVTFKTCDHYPLLFENGPNFFSRPRLPLPSITFTQNLPHYP